MIAPRWAYGVTTVPERADSLLPRTLDSLFRAGFEQPRLFVDGMASGHPSVTARGLLATYRYPKVGAWGNWVLAIYELYIREPLCERYAVFQDDLVAVRDLRVYLDRCRYPDGKDGRPPGFWNLYTALNAEHHIRDLGGRCGWVEAPGSVTGSDEDRRMRVQSCRGALGLVFNREAVQVILQAPSAVGKPASSHRPERNIDGAVVTAMNLRREDPPTGRKWPFGWREYVHGPSLLRHTGTDTTIHSAGDGMKVWEEKSAAHTFPGEDWSALDMLAPAAAPAG